MKPDNLCGGVYFSGNTSSINLSGCHNERINHINNTKAYHLPRYAGIVSISVHLPCTMNPHKSSDSKHLYRRQQQLHLQMTNRHEIPFWYLLVCRRIQRYELAHLRLCSRCIYRY